MGMLHRAANNFFHLKGHMPYYDTILVGQNKILVGQIFIHHCHKMIYDQKIVRTLCPTTLGI